MTTVESENFVGLEFRGFETMNKFDDIKFCWINKTYYKVVCMYNFVVVLISLINKIDEINEIKTSTKISVSTVFRGYNIPFCADWTQGTILDKLSNKGFITFAW